MQPLLRHLPALVRRLVDLALVGLILLAWTATTVAIR
jgi:hypothetical protein